MSMETMKLEQLIQATSGLSNRKETPTFANGEPITEIRIVISMIRCTMMTVFTHRA